ncbi:haloacid dehalogenase [Spirochaetia bacterium]|nr:haloacid dehalogenase [Spirochaetia bacterium]
MQKRTLDPSTIKALALDLDGTTLAPGAVLTERTIRAINACREKGLAVIIATGRAIEAGERFRIPLGAEGPMVYFNGAVVADMPGAKILSAALLDLEAVNFCIDLSRSTGVYYQVFLPGTTENPRQRLVAERPGAERDMYHNHTGIQAEIEDLKAAVAAPGITGCIKSMFLAEPEVQDAIRPRIEERFGKSLYIARTLRTFLEIMNPRVSKGEGLKAALQRRGLDAAQVIAFGDEENDLPMFGATGFAAAPANAKESVRNAADIIIGPNTEDGIAAFLEETFL